MLKKWVIIVFALFIGVAITTSEIYGQHASFSITTTGSNDTVDSAIVFTTNIWSQYLYSNVPIKIKVIYTPLTIAGPLGITFPNGKKDFAGCPQNSTWYPTCLANALSNAELNSGEMDMDIYMNSDFNWYFGTDGNPSPSQYDFVSVLLHEIGHGLGFASLAKVEGANGSFGLLTQDDYLFLTTSFPFPNLLGLPSIFDVQLVNGNNESLPDTSNFPNNSSLLKSQLSSNDVYYSGYYGVVANNSNPPRIYAPTTFALGSSITHLNESTYPSGSGNELMTPFSSKGNAVHTPGDILLGVLEDIGWAGAAAGVGTGKSYTLRMKVYPNPTIDNVIFAYVGGQREKISIEIYNLLGQNICTLTNQVYENGVSHLIWNGRNDIGSKVKRGTYFYRANIASGFVLGKLILLEK